jgi:hypothetical protein
MGIPGLKPGMKFWLLRIRKEPAYWLKFCLRLITTAMGMEMVMATETASQTN